MGRNFEEHIKAAELQLVNKDKNPTVKNLLIDLHKGINYYKEKAERLEAELKAETEAFEKAFREVFEGEEICNFCKNQKSETVCFANDCSCEDCTEECVCKLCGFEGERCNFEWRGRR